MPSLRLSIVAGPVRPVPRIGWRELFEHRARLTPHRIGVVGDVAWTFGELEHWSGLLANVLCEAGAAPGTVVAGTLTRSVRAVLAPLAVARTGAAYLPIDPAQPPARVGTILADARPAVVLTDVAELGTAADVVLSPDGWQSEITRDRRPLPGVPAGGPAYVVYTSGSTGRPKGVVVGNRSLVNLYHELAARFFPAGGPQRVAHGLPLAFDAAWNPLLWLLGGHELHLVPDDVRADPEHYVRFIRDHRLTVVEAVSPHLSALVDAGLLDGDTRPRLLLMGGEAVGQTLWSRLRAEPGLTALNLYGPTECTVFTTACDLAERPAPAIGRPIGNTRAQVVDTELRPVPVGEPGELLVGGACLATGYLGQPELTAERFVATPRRWYRTGDHCRCLPDGTLDWLGRLDDQVKIRGHRVEPGEVEHALGTLPGVRQAAVRADGDETTRRLIAYVVLDTGTTADEVHDRLRALLPGYLVPAAVVPLEALPLGPRGKIDRAALPPPVTGPPATLTPAEELVAAAFRAQLGVASLTAGSDFFALGGHSLSAAALATRLRAHGVPCSLRDVLRRRTIAQLAELVPGRTVTP